MLRNQDKYSKNNHIFFIGDFIDNLLESLDEKDFFKTWSMIHAKLKQQHVHGIFIIQKDIHNQRIIRLIEQFSDVSVDLKEVENKYKISTYIKVTNYQDNIRTNWFKK